ncbi:hypothetical protein QEP66_01015 [Streptomyces sp. LB8]|uniref:hypothetical protein n=1 Tax=Streptomyces sp. LB8 TaxID=3042509 RepID=UPI0026490E06|nr:hypothetical protein [Streptomyces sp. LB8]MDN5380711.1 hypothetical protein [Streptomyces sp. LB8]
MSRARTGAHRPNQHERRQRRAAIEHLLARALRGALTIPEAAVLADYWRQEQRAADATRKSLTDTTRALEQHREAADSAIRELEAERDRLAAQLRAVEQAKGEQQRTTVAALDASQATLARYRERAEAAEERAQVISADRDRLAAELDAAENRRRALADALAVNPATAWPQLLAHARAYVHHTDTWRTLAVRRRKRAERAENERDRYRAAWQSARQGRAEQRTLAERAEEAEQRLARIRAMADGWKRRLPAVIRTATAADAVRYAADGDDRPVMFAITAEQALAERAEPEVITDRAAIRAALDEPEPRPAPQHIGGGANAEDCPACDGTNPPYPFICPGPASQ